MTFGEYIKSIMKQRGITQVMMGKFIGLGTQSAVRSRLDSKNPTIDGVVEILDVLGYELVIQEKRQGRRPEGQYVVGRMKE